MGELIRGLLGWPVELITEAPRRAGRFTAALAAVVSIRSPGGILYWLQVVVWYLFDLCGAPELVELVLHQLTDSRPLTASEMSAAVKVFGSRTIRLSQVRVASGGLLPYAFQRNKNRAFVTWHTINIPQSKVGDLSLLIHELTHVLQYEKVGSIYIFQGLWAQHKLGRQAYNYGGLQGLKADHTAGKRFNEYNREQQGQIAQDYFKLLADDAEVDGYEPFISELRRGRI